MCNGQVNLHNGPKSVGLLGSYSNRKPHEMRSYIVPIRQLVD